MEHISGMRELHEAHIGSLKEAHQKEIESHKSYINFLERRRGLPSMAPQTGRQHLTIDTSHAGTKVGELYSADASATTMQSFESSLENQKRASQEAMAEVEMLKRKLSLCRKTVAESTEVRQERDHFRDAAERSNRRILQLKDIVRKAKEHEKTLKNAVSGLEASLCLANEQRVDVLEGFHEASEQVRKLGERERNMAKEIEHLRGRLFYANGRHASDTTLALPDMNPMARPKHNRTKSDVRGLASSHDPMVQQLQDLRRLVAAQDAKIRQLQETASRPQPVDHDPSVSDRRMTSDCSEQVAELVASLAEHQQKLAAAEADRERYKSLLHNELRRQSRYAAQSRTPLQHRKSRIRSLRKRLRRSGLLCNWEAA